MLDKNTLYWYGRIVSDNDKAKLTDTITTVYIDAQNFDNCNELLCANGFQIAYEGYQLTGNNDLYQYCYTR